MMSEIPGITFHLNMVFLGAFPKQFPKSNKADIPGSSGFLSSQNCSKYQLRHIDAAFHLSLHSLQNCYSTRALRVRAL